MVAIAASSPSPCSATCSALDVAIERPGVDPCPRRIDTDLAVFDDDGVRQRKQFAQPGNRHVERGGRGVRLGLRPQAIGEPLLVHAPAAERHERLEEFERLLLRLAMHRERRAGPRQREVALASRCAAAMASCGPRSPEAAHAVHLDDPAHEFGLDAMFQCERAHRRAERRIGVEAVVVLARARRGECSGQEIPGAGLCARTAPRRRRPCESCRASLRRGARRRFARCA